MNPEVLNTIMAQAAAFGVFKLAAALLVMWLMSRFFDWLGGIRWGRDVFPTIISEPLAASHYYGARLLAFAVAVGLASG